MERMSLNVVLVLLKVFCLTRKKTIFLIGDEKNESWLRLEMLAVSAEFGALTWHLSGVEVGSEQCQTFS